MDDNLKGLFSQKLKDFQMKQAEVGMSIFSMSPEEREEKTEQLKGENEEFESELMGLLGAENYEEYKEYKSTIGARAQVNLLKNYGFSLSDKQKNKEILDMVIETQKHFGVGGEEDEEDQYDLSKVGENMSKMVDRNKKMSDEYLLRANDILNKDELERFRLSLGQYNKTIEMSAKMSKMFLGKDKDSEEEK